MSTRFSPYPAYRPSGIDWIGDIPFHWDVKRVKHLAVKIGSGKTPSGGAAGYVNEGVTFIRSQNVRNEGIDLGDVAFIELSADGEQAFSRVKSQDLLLNITGASLGRCCLAPAGIEPANVNQHVCIIRPKSPTVPRFLWRNIISAPVQAQIFQTEQGISREGLNFEQVGNIGVAVPPQPEQQAIATFLDRETDKIDALIDKQRRLVKLLREKRQAVICRAVTKGLDQHAPMKPSGVDWLSDIPAHWRVMPLGRMFRERDERARPELPLLSVSISSGVTVRDLGPDQRQQQAEDHTTYKVARRNDLVFNKMRMWQGASGLAPVDGLVSPDYTVAAPCAEFDPSFIALVLRVPSFLLEVNRYSKGIVPDRNRLYWDEFKILKVPFPPLEEQTVIASHVQAGSRSIETLTATVEKFIELLAAQRTSLIAAAVTGKIDVRVASKALDEPREAAQ